jgi:ribosomal protein L37AE/L43A
MAIKKPDFICKCCGEAIYKPIHIKKEILKCKKCGTPIKKQVTFMGF